MKPSRLKSAISHIVLILASILFIIPFIWMLSTALKPDSQIFTFPPKWLPSPIKYGNFIDAINAIPFWTYLKNTVVITGFSVLGVVLTCPLIAYSFAKLEWRGRNVMFALTLAVMMIPGQVTMIPLFLIFNKIGWVGTPLPLIVPQFFGVPFFIFLLRQFFKSFPDTLREAAKIDGASEIRIYWQIILPLAKPAVLAVGLFQLINSWRDFLGPLIYLTHEKTYTLSVGLQQFQSEQGTDWSLMMSMSTIMILPVIVLFFFMQKAFIEGITFSGGIKG